MDNEGLHGRRQRVKFLVSEFEIGMDDIGDMLGVTGGVAAEWIEAYETLRPQMQSDIFDVVLVLVQRVIERIKEVEGTMDNEGRMRPANLKARVRSARIRQGDIADLLEVSPVRVSQWLNGLRDLTADEEIRLEVAVHILNLAERSARKARERMLEYGRERLRLLPSAVDENS